MTDNIIKNKKQFEKDTKVFDSVNKIKVKCYSFSSVLSSGRPATLVNSERIPARMEAETTPTQFTSFSA